MNKIVVAVMCGVSLALVAGEWAKPAWIPREKGLFRSQIQRGGGMEGYSRC